jgi:hypothetical protein
MLFRCLFAAIAGCTCANPTPASLWTSSLGYNVTLASNKFSEQTFGTTLFSPDAASIYVAEAYLPYVGAPNAILRVLALDSTTGVQQWTYSPQFLVPTERAFASTGFAAFCLLSADSSTIFVLMPSVDYKTYVFAVQANSGASMGTNSSARGFPDHAKFRL